MAIIILFLSCVLLAGADGGLTVFGHKQCGEKVCQINQYCDSIDDICKNCDNICNPNKHNVQESECAQQCQDYLHDIRYQRHIDGANDVYEEMRRLYVISTISLALSTLAILAVMIILFFFYLHVTNKLDKIRFKKKIHKPIQMDYINQNAERDPRNQIKSEISVITLPETKPVENGIPQTPSTEFTTVSMTKRGVDTNISTQRSTPRRHPSEDNTLGYAYDNPALTPSPSPPGK